MTCIVKGEGVKKNVRINIVFDKYLVICYINIYTLQIIPQYVAETDVQNGGKASVEEDKWGSFISPAHFCHHKDWSNLPLRFSVDSQHFALQILRNTALLVACGI